MNLDCELVVLSLARRPDRQAAIERRLAEQALVARIQHGTDGSLAALPLGWRVGPGAYGCYRSHLDALAGATGDSDLLVLEDDAVLCPDFAGRLGQTRALLPADWQLLMLGGEHRAPPAPVAPGLGRARASVRTHGYLVRARSLPAVRRALTGGRSYLSDRFLELQRDFAVYVADPWLVEQDLALDSDIGSPPYGSLGGSSLDDSATDVTGRKLQRLRGIDTGPVT